MKNKNSITIITLVTVLFFGYGFVSYAQDETVNQEIETIELVETNEVPEEEVLPEIKMKSVRYPEKALKSLDAFDYSVARLQNLSGRISNKINEMESESASLGTARNDIKEANNLIRHSYGELKKIKEMMRRIMATGLYEEGYVESTRTQLNAIKKSGEGAQAIMQKIVASLVALEGPTQVEEDNQETENNNFEGGVLDSVHELLSDTNE